jgi:pimeloyl-ACP methyl ester carboxylesterase
MPNDDAGRRAPPTYILVHGTFARRAPWTHPDSDLRAVLLESEPASQFHTPNWTGHNLFVARQQAARELENIIDGVSADQPIIVIGHSHGGSAVAHLLRSRPDLHARLCGIAYLATPFIALRKHEQLATLWSSLTILAGLFSAFAIGVVLAMLAVAFKAYESDVLTPIALFGSAAIVCLVISMTFRRLGSIKESVAKLKTSITDYCDTNETASIKVDTRTLFVRATGDEAASLLAFFQFIGLVTSRLGSFTDRALVQINHAVGSATSGILGKLAFGGLVVCAQMWIIFTAQYYGNPSEPFYPWSVPDDIYIGFCGLETPTWFTPHLRALHYPIAWFVTGMGVAMLVVFLGCGAPFVV